MSISSKEQELVDALTVLEALAIHEDTGWIPEKFAAAWKKAQQRVEHALDEYLASERN